MRLLALLLLASVCAAREFRVHGVVREGVRKPVAARVTVWDSLDPARFLGEASADEEGEFAVVLDGAELARRAHPYGPLLFRVRGEGLAETRRAIAFGSALEGVRLRVRQAQRFHGRVRDHLGQPAPGVRVEAIGMPGSGSRSPLSVVESTTTNESGRFVLERFHSGPVGIEAQGPGTPPARGIWKLGDEIAIQLPAPVEEGPGSDVPSLRGRVLDEYGRPVEGVRVARPGAIEGAWTDESGGYLLEVSGPASMIALEATKPGYLVTRLRVETGRGGRVELRLRRGGQAAGRAVPARPGLRVSALAEGEGRGPDGLPAPGREVAFAFTDPEGRFLLEGIPPEATRLIVWSETARSLAHALPAEGPLRCELRDKLPLTGVLRDDSGAALAGVEVYCSTPSGSLVARTGATGRFRFGELGVQDYALKTRPVSSRHGAAETQAWPGDDALLIAPTRFGDRSLDVEVVGAPGRVQMILRRREPPRVRRSEIGSRQVFEHLPPGLYDLQVSAEGRIDVHREIELAAEGARQAIAVTPQEGGILHFRARPGARVAVQTLEGEPAPLVVLELGHGELTVRGFGPGRYRFLSRAEGELVAIRDVRCGPQVAPQTIDLHAGAAATLEVLVTDRAGSPVEGARVTLSARSGFEWPAQRTTDATGRLILRHLPAGRLEVRVELGGRMAAAPVDVTPGAELRVPITLP